MNHVESDQILMMNLEDVIFVQTGTANHLLVVDLTLKVKSQKMSKIWTSFEYGVSHGCKSVFELELGIYNITLPFWKSVKYVEMKVFQ